MPRSRPRAAPYILKKKTLEEDTDLVRRTDIKCDHPSMAPPGPLGHMWTTAATLTLRFCHNTRTQRHEITHATGLVEEGDGESVAVTVQDTMATRNSREKVLQDTRAANRRGKARTGGLPQLADFGDKAWAWPGDPAQAVRTSFPVLQLQDLWMELRWRLVDHVAIQVRGRTACVATISVPMLDPWPGVSLSILFHYVLKLSYIHLSKR